MVMRAGKVNKATPGVSAKGTGSPVRAHDRPRRESFFPFTPPRAPLPAETAQITGGNFTDNEADFGGFLYKRGEGTASCSGAYIARNSALDGGALYVSDDATLDWQCDLNMNSALSGAAMCVR